jgi:hypothetical protein
VKNVYFGSRSEEDKRVAKIEAEIKLAGQIYVEK